MVGSEVGCSQSLPRHNDRSWVSCTRWFWISVLILLLLTEGDISNLSLYDSNMYSTPGYHRDLVMFEELLPAALVHCLVVLVGMSNRWKLCLKQAQHAVFPDGTCSWLCKVCVSPQWFTFHKSTAQWNKDVALGGCWLLISLIPLFPEDFLSGQESTILAWKPYWSPE